MTDSPQASGADLARQALATWKAGRTPGQTSAPKKKPRRGARTDRTGGRDPIGLNALLGQLNAEQGWGASLDGGNILEQWATLCPQYDGRVQPAAYDAERGRLDLRPASDAYAAQLRLLGGQLCKQINDKLGRDAVRAVRVLPVGTITPPETPTATEELSRRDNPEPAPAAPAARNPLALEVRAIHDTHKPPSGTHLNPRTRAAITRSDRALADPARREPEHAFTDAVAERERLETAVPAPGSMEASIRAAIAAKYRGPREPRRLFEASS